MLSFVFPPFVLLSGVMRWTFRRLLFRLLLLRVRCRVLQSLPYHLLLSFSIVCYIIYSVVYQRTVNVITVIAVRHTAAIPQSNMWFPPFVSFFSIELFIFVCFPFLWLQYSTVIFAASLQRSLQFQKNKKKSLFLRFAQQKAPCFVHIAQPWALGAKKENARKCCERFVVFCYGIFYIRVPSWAKLRTRLLRCKIL